MVIPVSMSVQRYGGLSLGISVSSSLRTVQIGLGLWVVRFDWERD